MSETRTSSLAGPADEASVRGLRKRALLVSGMGFFTDAYDLFVIGIVSTLLKTEWHLATGQLAVLNAVMLGAAFLGALVFGRVADVIGRNRVYWMSPRSWSSRRSARRWPRRWPSWSRSGSCSASASAATTRSARC